MSQYVVGNGFPSSSCGDCSVTAGRPQGQRTATRRKARARGRSAARRRHGRPSGQVRSVPPVARRHSGIPRTMKRRSPGLTSPSRRAPRTRVEPLRISASRSSRSSCGWRVTYLGGAGAERVLRVEIRMDRPVVEEPEQHDDAEREPARKPAASPGAKHGARFLRRPCRATPLRDVDLDQVRRAGDVHGRARRDHHPVTGVDEAGVARGGDRRSQSSWTFSASAGAAG